MQMVQDKETTVTLIYIYMYIHFQIKLIELCLLLLYFNPIVPKQYGV